MVNRLSIEDEAELKEIRRLRQLQGHTYKGNGPRCGTVAGLQDHKKLNNFPCAACRNASAASYKERNVHNRAREATRDNGAAEGESTQG